jgi:transposase
VRDQLKSGVTKSCRYEPGIQRRDAEMARHYGTAIVPARPYKARDKAKFEVGVQIAQRWTWRGCGRGDYRKRQRSAHG